MYAIGRSLIDMLLGLHSLILLLNRYGSNQGPSSLPVPPTSVIFDSPYSILVSFCKIVSKINLKICFCLRLLMTCYRSECRRSRVGQNMTSDIDQGFHFTTMWMSIDIVSCKWVACGWIVKTPNTNALDLLSSSDWNNDAKNGIPYSMNII